MWTVAVLCFHFGLLQAAVKNNLCENPSGSSIRGRFDDPISTTHVLHPTDCSKFYKCDGGIAYEMRCPSSLHWSVQIGRCEQPSTANCQIALSMSNRLTEEIPPVKSQNVCTKGSYKKIQFDKNNCEKYIQCVDGTQLVLECPSPLGFNNTLRACDNTIRADCTTNVRIQSYIVHLTSKTEKEEPHLDQNCPPNEDPQDPTHLLYSGNCSKFYKCYLGYAYPMDCPSGLQWSIEWNRCEWPNIAKCDPNGNFLTSPTNPTASSAISPPATEEPKPNPNCPPNENPQTPTHLPYPGDCSKFYKCLAGLAYPLNCPPGLQWSIELDRCEWPDIAKCDPNGNNPTNPPNPPASSTTPPPATEEPKPNPNCPPNENPQTPTHLPYPGDCSKFYKCLAGLAYPLNCPSGLQWSIELDRCEWPDIAKCDPNGNNPTNPPNPPASSTTPPPATEEPKPNPNCPPNENPQTPTHLPYPGDCSKFYKCLAGLAYPLNCPPGLQWSTEFDRCEWPEIAKCDPNASYVPEEFFHSNSEQHKAPIIPSPEEQAKPNARCPPNENPQNPTQLPYPEDCSKFYKCLSGLAYPQNCPAGLHWSVEFNQCDWPDVAQCKSNQSKLLTKFEIL